jgi:hypothetical protein
MFNDALKGAHGTKKVKNNRPKHPHCLWAHQPSCLIGAVPTCLGSKSPPYSAEFKNEWKRTSSSLCTLIAEEKEICPYTK